MCILFPCIVHTRGSLTGIVLFAQKFNLILLYSRQLRKTQVSEDCLRLMLLGVK